MAAKTRKAGSKAVVKKEKDKNEKRFKDAMVNLEKVAKERLQTARDPFSAGIKMVTQIRELALRIENEIEDESMTITEAGYASGGMLGVGI